MFGECPNCGTKFKKSELKKLSYHMEAYKDESKYVKCHRCGRFFVTHIGYSLLYLAVALCLSLLSFVSSFFLAYPRLGLVLGIFGVSMLLFRSQIHRFLPVIDVSDTAL